MPPENNLKTTVETEAKSTMDMFQNVADGRGNLWHVFKEIEKDRQTFGIGTAQEKAYTESVHWKLVKSNLLPEISLKYACDNFSNLSCGDVITDDSFKRFRVAGYKDMTSVEKSINNYLMQNYDVLKNQTTPGVGTCVSMDDINMAMGKAKAARNGCPGDGASDFPPNAINLAANPRVHEMMSNLTANGGDLALKLMDCSEGGITKKSLQHALDYDNHYYKLLSKQERPVVKNMLDDFDDISGGDDVITPLDLKYYGGKYGESTLEISREKPRHTSDDAIRPFGKW